MFYKWEFFFSEEYLEVISIYSSYTVLLHNHIIIFTKKIFLFLKKKKKNSL